jgi:hypothetical protein
MPLATAGQWKRISLTFTTPKWDPYIDLRFVAAGKGKAYFDDFSIKAIKAEPGK